MNQKLIKVFFILLFLMGCSNDSPDKILAESKIMITKLEYSEALEKLQKLVENYPQSIEAAEGQYMIGDTYIAYNKNFEVALKEYRKVVDNYPESKFAINAQFMIGYVFANFLNDYNSARIEYETFLELFSSKADSGLVESVKFELRNLGKDLNEIPQLKHISP
ncbi:MAG: hypothetical protein CMG75_10505 [Candidatus Marinimicrobia bacterium]|nr:hypothetical protein [Candidatus Neomarinimicrobiota bacterium]